MHMKLIKLAEFIYYKLINITQNVCDNYKNILQIID